MRSSIAICSCTILILTAACGLPLPSSQPSPTVVPTAAAPGTAPPAAGTTPAQPAPAAPAGTAYQTQGTLESGGATPGNVPVTVQVVEFRRISGNMLLLRLALIVGEKKVSSVYAGSAVRDTYLVDPAQQKKYEVMKDESSSALASQISTDLMPGERHIVFAQFSAPPPTTTTMNIYFGGKMPIMDVPITQ